MTDINSKLVKHTILFSLFVLLAQVIGLVRDLYLARVFGLGPTLDVYYMAFKVPDFLNIFYSVFLGSVVFIPLLTLAKNSQGLDDNKQEIIKKVREVGSLVLTLIVLAGVLLYIFMPSLASMLAPTWNSAQLELLTNLSRILLIAQFFFPVGILAGSIGMIYGRPAFMAMSGFIYNLFILLGAIILTPYFGIYGVVIGVIIGAFGFMVVQVIPHEVRDIFKKFRFQINFSEWVSFFRANFLRFFAVLAYQLFGILLLYIASYSGAGGVSAFSISYNIFLALFFILGASLSTAAMPNIAKLHVTGDKVQQKENLNNSLVYMFFIGTFTALFGLVFSQDIIKILYYFSNLGIDKELYIAAILALLVLALPFFNLLEIIRKYLYSTNQIPFASIMTILLLFGVLISSVFFNKIMGIQILPSLVYSILVSNVFCFLFSLFVLQMKEQVSLKFISLNIYKPILIFMLSFLAFAFTQQYVLLFSNYFVELILRACLLLLFFLFFMFLSRDKVGKNIVRQLVKVIV